MKQAKNKLLSFFTAFAMLLPMAAQLTLMPSAAAAGTPIEWTFDEAAPEGVARGTKEWYIEDTDYNGLTIKANGTEKNENEYNNAFEIDRDASGDFSDEKVTGALKFGGKSTADARFLLYTPAEDGTLTVYVKHGSPNGTDIRSLTVTQGSNETTIDTYANNYVPADGSSVPEGAAPNVKQDVTVTGGTEIKITVGGNVGLAKLVFTPGEGGGSEPGGDATPPATTAPATTAPATTAPATTAPATTEPAGTEPTDYLQKYEWYPDATLSADEAISDVPGLYSVGAFDRFSSSSKTFEDGTQTSTYVSNNNVNGGWGSGAATGTALRFDAPADGILYVYIIDISNKDVFIAKEGCADSKNDLPDVAEAYIRAGSSSQNLIISAEVNGGETYYAFADGTKGRYAAVKFFRTGEFIETSPDQETADRVASEIELGSVSQSSVYFDIDLPNSGDDRTEITWESSNTDYIDIQSVSHINRCLTGVVTRPQPSDPNIVDGGVPVTLTATVTKGDASATREFDVSVREWNPIYYNDFQGDVGQPADGAYLGIQDNVEAANGKDTFRGIRVDKLSDSKSMEGFNNNEHDRPANFDKRIMSTDSVGYDRPQLSEGEDENFAFYYSAWHPYGGQTTYTPLWIELIDPATGTAPEGVVMLSMDLYVITSDHRFSMGFGTSSASQMCRFTLYNSKPNTSLGYNGGGALRYMSNTVTNEFMGGTGGYRVPIGDWIKVAIVANSWTHKWDFYFDGMLVGKDLDFRNAEDMISTIEFTMDRSDSPNYTGSSYLLDNIYVENLTSDYVDRYWDDFEVYTLPYDETEQAYVLDKTNILPYMGREALYGSQFTWRSSDTSVLNVSRQNVPVDELADYGYTDAQIQEYKNQGLTEVMVIKAVPGTVYEDTKVTLTGYIDIDGETLSKTFDVIVKANAEAAETQTPRPTAGTGGNGGGGGAGGGGGGGGTTSSVQGNGGSAIVSGNGTPNNTVTNNNTQTATPRPQGAPSFDDLDAVPWAQEAIEYLFLKDIVNGYGNGIYGVNDSVTREQFVKMIITALGLNLYEIDETDFTDVEQGAWYEVYINSAVHYGIINGISETEFGVGQPISRQDMAVMSMRALDYINGVTDGDTDADGADDTADDTETGTDADGTESGTDTDGTETGGTEAESGETADETADDANGGLTEEEEAEYVRSLFESMTFTDKDEIADYAVKSIARMAGSGYLTGDDTGKFRPRSSSTRAETAVMIYRIIR